MSVASLPWYFRVAKKMILNDVRGGWRLMHALQSLGLLHKVCAVPYFAQSQLLVPLEWGWYWSFAELSEYEPTTLKAFAQRINATATGPAIHLDCGAHIGLVSHYVAQTCPSVKATWSFEPNPALFQVLQANSRAIGHPVTAVNQALSDFTGRARLVLPAGNEDGAYILPDDQGAIDVTRVDDMALPQRQGVVMKIDVEGSELAILKGAEATLRQAPFFVVLFEAHKDVLRRTGVDPMECVRFLNSLRACRWMPSAHPDVALALDQPFFSQMPQHTKRDIIVWSV